jgi:hypothetical protein
MPNHVITEVVFRNVSKEKRAEILAMISGAEREIDFETLLPIPLNVWQGSVGSRHEAAFGKPLTGLDWCRENWGTKWNAYGLDEGDKYRSVDQTPDALTLTFQTAWSTPYGWLLALWHKSGCPFEYTWLDEGRNNAFFGRFTSYDDDMRGEPWSEAEADEATTRRMRKLMFGVETFEEDDA